MDNSWEFEMANHPGTNTKSKDKLSCFRITYQIIEPHSGVRTERIALIRCPNIEVAISQFKVEIYQQYTPKVMETLEIMCVMNFNKD